VNGVRRFRDSFPVRTGCLFFDKPIADQTSCTRVGTWLTVGRSRAGKTSSSFSGTPPWTKVELAGRETVFKFELLGDFAMSEMRSRNDRERHGR
jgi:hypothetical protein